MPPGWYPDPADPGGVRWWDGYAWSAATRPFQATSFDRRSFNADTFNPEADLKDEVASSRPASVAVLVGAVAYLLQSLYLVYFVAQFWPKFERFLNSIDGPSDTVVPPGPASIGSLSLLSNLFGLVLLAVAVLFVIWLRRAAIVARRAGLPATHDPVWAILGFLVPVVSLWFPYQVARDLFPPRHPGRALVKRWWTLWIGLTVLAYPILIAAIISIPVAVALALLAGAIALWCAQTARQIIAACGQAHASLLGH